MIWSLSLIIVSTAILLAFEFRNIRKQQKLMALENAWPQFEETYVSALQSGISTTDAFSFLSDFELPQFHASLQELVQTLDRGMSLSKSLEKFRNQIGLTFCDLFVAIVLVAHHAGGQNLIAALQEHVEAVRFELGAKGDVRARQSAILSVAKLGLLAPWVLLAVLCTNPQTKESFSSGFGPVVLIGGFAVCFIAYRLIIRVGHLNRYRRILAGADA